MSAGRFSRRLLPAVYRQMTAATTAAAAPSGRLACSVA